ncbi:hypothetical protein B8W66_18155 [Mycobacterium decipiens]|uniref:Uncharacterized protein n=1 Tax=Mycobacterium decipiens TaxID=1430326 RepID=A0A1X2LR52_9MYCO|nr:hypothetical protein B8W66_18155 [Mycobacterium decipiens]
MVEPLTWPNEVTFHRWCSAVGTRSCTMRVRLQGANGGRIETEGFWTNLDKDTLTPSPITDGFFNRLATTTEEHQLKWHPWLPDPVPEGSASFSFPLRHTDIGTSLPPLEMPIPRTARCRARQIQTTHCRMTSEVRPGDKH